MMFLACSKPPIGLFPPGRAPAQSDRLHLTTAGKFSLVLLMVPMEGVEPTHSFEYQILSLARLPIPPHRPTENQQLTDILLRELDDCDSAAA